MPITTRINHIATLTPDMDRLVRFYTEAFGAKVTFELTATEEHPRMVVLDLGGGGALNVFEVAEDQIIGARRTIGGRGPIDHSGIAVDSHATLSALRERMVAAGAEIGEIQRLGGEW